MQGVLRNLHQASGGAADNEAMLKVLAKISHDQPIQQKRVPKRTKEQVKQDKEKTATSRRENLKKSREAKAREKDAEREAKARAKNAEIRTKYLAHLAAIGEEPPVWFK
jgi:hypothetical protein